MRTSPQQAEIDRLSDAGVTDDSYEVEFETVVSEAEEEATECLLDTEEPAQEQEEQKPEEDGTMPSKPHQPH